MVHCTRPGCGVDFEPGTSSQEGSCVWHSGAPVFHEGSKSWSCCKDVNKPVLEFDEFLKIKGCSTEDGHTDLKREKETFQKPSNGGVSNADLEAIPTATTTNGNGSASTSSAGQSVTPMSSKVLSASKAETSNAKEAAAYVEEEDPAEAQDLASGHQCKRTGCKATHSGGTRDRPQEECRFHKGVAIFHEGSKGYTCCRRRVLEFDEFLTIEPCTTSSKGHLFVGAAKASQLDNGGEEEAQCRLDHYETPADVRVTVYAKNVEMDRSNIEIQDEQVLFSLALPPITANHPSRRFKKTLLPFSQIDATASTFKVTKFKIDLILVKKVKGESWPTLERGERSYGYGLTFGRNKDA
jgi:hypothetical protein